MNSTFSDYSKDYNCDNTNYGNIKYTTHFIQSQHSIIFLKGRNKYGMEMKVYQVVSVSSVRVLKKENRRGEGRGRRENFFCLVL